MRALMLMLALAGASAVFAQTYPSKPVQLVVPVPVGALPDIDSRAFARQLGEELGQQIVVENRPGAGGTIGAAAVAKAAADGHTLLWGLPLLAIGPTLFPNPGADTPLAPISLIQIIPSFLVVHPSVPATSLREFIDHARARPGKLNYSSAGPGTYPHIAMEMFKGVTGLDLVHVPYRGNHFSTLVAGEVQVAIEGPSTLTSFVRAGKARLLAVTGASRHPDYPDIPTAKEAGIPFEVVGWAGLLAPHGTPGAVIARLNEAVRKTVASQAMRDWYAKMGSMPATSSPAEFATFIRVETDRWTRAWKSSGAKLD